MLNKFIAMGRLVADPEYKVTPQGTAVATFTLAVERNYAQGGEKKTDFVNCVAWRGTADFISKYFSKGRLMMIESELQSRTYENKEGRKVTAWEAIVSNAYFCGDKQEANTAGGTPQGFIEIAVDDDSDLPF